MIFPSFCVSIQGSNKQIKSTYCRYVGVHKTTVTHLFSIIRCLVFPEGGKCLYLIEEEAGGVGW